MLRFRLRRLAVRAGLVRAKSLDPSSSEWADVRVALREGRRAYAEAVAANPAPDVRSSDDRATRVDYSQMMQ
jgi:hypothetical protein